jgi:hypothetical protein
MSAGTYVQPESQYLPLLLFGIGISLKSFMLCLDLAATRTFPDGNVGLLQQIEVEWLPVMIDLARDIADDYE